MMAIKTESDHPKGRHSMPLVIPSGQSLLDPRIAEDFKLSKWALRVLMITHASLALDERFSQPQYRDGSWPIPVIWFSDLIQLLVPGGAGLEHAVNRALSELLDVGLIGVKAEEGLSLEWWGTEPDGWGPTEVICYRKKPDPRRTLTAVRRASTAAWKQHLATSALVYVVYSENLKALKIGLSSDTYGFRLDQHAGQGWVTLLLEEVPSVPVARLIECQVLHDLRVKEGAPPALVPEQMPQGGWSETVSTMHIRVEDMLNLVKKKLSTATDMLVDSQHA